MRPHSVLPPVSEASEYVPPGTPGWESAVALCVRAVSDITEATTPRQGEISGSDSSERTASELVLPVWRSVEEWPVLLEARGRFTLRAYANPQAYGKLAMCRIRKGVLKLVPKQRAAAGEKTELVTEVPVEMLAVGLQRGRTDMFALATTYENKLFDEIYCFCDDSVKRNTWIEIFRGMGVAIFDLRD